jgi:HPt (histidine-containing phosphotransfer) domain-containing protein
MDADQKSTAALPSTDPTALDRLKRFGGASLLGRMVDLFLVAAPGRIEAASAAAAAGDASGVELALHSLKSSSAQLGALRLQRLSAAGELRAREGSLDGLGSLVVELEQELARVREWLTIAREGAA